MTTTLIQNKPLYEGIRVTREAYLDLENDGFKYDMVNGVLHMSPSAFSQHGKCQGKLSYFFENYLIKNRAGCLILEVDIFLPDEGDVLRPDIVIILKENYNIIKNHIHGVPDIVVEILSEATRTRDLGVKADRYLSNGVKEYWIADPDEKTIALWINIDKKNWNKKEDHRLESSVLRGFVLKQEEVFL